ncbi:MAG: sigma-70 family RNA polymerase sigma factor [Phycisphaerales bacterium]|nr:sigma-70 family RNA polymerase sigma factor [Phycisphaerales bacterium]
MPDHRITEALQRVTQGHGSAVDQILPLVYDELRDLARAFMRHQPAGHTLQPTALVHEACAKMLGPNAGVPENRVHFFAIAARAMRQVLANHARDKRAAKRSPDGHQLTCSDIETPSGGGRVDMVDLDEALTELSKLDERQYRLVELRFFAGMTIEEAAQAMNVSQSTIEREWRMARAWLGARLRDGYEL